MRFYETTVVLSPLSDDAAIGHEVDKITQIITGASGKLVTVQRWGVKRMAYPILKHTQACYVHFVYQSPPSVPGRLESMFRINESILRHLTVLVEGPLSGGTAREPAQAAAETPLETSAGAEEKPAESAVALAEATEPVAETNRDQPEAS